MARRKTNNKPDNLVVQNNIQEMQMLFNSDFSDAQLEHFLNKGMIKVSEKLEKPPQILWVGDCTIATFGNFSASTGKAKSKKTFNVSAMVAAALINGTVLIIEPACHRESERFSTSIPSKAVIIVESP